VPEAHEMRSRESLSWAQDARVSHPDPAAAPDTRPLEPGEVWENPVTLERAVLVEAPWWNDAGRAVSLT
jgi:hypothetical protein